MINSKINQTLTVVVLFFTVLQLSFSQGTSGQFPDVNIRTLEGEKIAISDHVNNGKITVVSFWATWCSPCKKELDAISDIYEEWQEEYDMELVAISVDNARSSAKVAPMVAQKGWEFTVYQDQNNEIASAMGFQSVPQTYLIDQAGNIVYTHSGYVPGDEFELEEKIAKLAK